MASLPYLKHSFDLSDEELVLRWSENIVWQFFSGREYYEARPPCHASQVVRLAVYTTGRGAAVDLPLAAHGYEAAAISGRIDAELPLADLYSRGLGVQVDYLKAAKLYQQVAMTGSEGAQILAACPPGRWRRRTKWLPAGGPDSF